VKPGDDLTVEFTRIGSLHARFHRMSSMENTHKPVLDWLEAQIFEGRARRRRRRTKFPVSMPATLTAFAMR
jgi:hypothetical protein